MKKYPGHGRVFWRRSVLLAAIALGCPGRPGALPAQETEGPLSPAGRLRVEFVPAYSSWDSRFGERSQDGSLVHEVEGLGFDLDDDTGQRLFPGIGELGTILRSFLADPGLEATLGRTRAQVTSSQIRLPVRVDLGLTDWLTVGVTVPLVKSRTEIGLAFRADSLSANLGWSPAILQAANVELFTAGLQAGAQAASGRASQRCAAAPSSTECQAATAVAAQGAALLAGFSSAYAASAFFPVTGTAAALALQGRFTAFNDGLASLGLGTLSRAPLFASTRLTRDDVDQLFSDADVGLNTVPLRDRVGLWELGDVEVHAALRLLEGTARDSAQEVRYRYLLGIGGLLRLGTGTRENPDLFLELSSGDGQRDLEGRVFLNLQAGRLGVWGDARYGIQQPVTVLKRIGPPDLVLVPAVNRATLEWTPGNYLQLELIPRFHFTSELAFTAAYRLFSKREDTFTRLSPALDPRETAPLPSPPLFTDPALLAEESAETLQELGGGLVFSTLEAWRAGRAAFPFEVWLDLRAALAGSGGRTPKATRASVGLRLFRRIWGS